MADEILLHLLAALSVFSSLGGVMPCAPFDILHISIKMVRIQSMSIFSFSDMSNYKNVFFNMKTKGSPDVGNLCA